MIDGEGSYRGGVIYPGINLSLEALHLGAAQLPSRCNRQTDSVIGTGTISAMRSGIFWGHVSMIEGMTTRIIDEFGAPMKVVATGGLAEFFNNNCNAIDMYDPNLTLRGLLAIHNLNKLHD